MAVKTRAEQRVMVRCPACGRSISGAAHACPGCGHPMRPGRGTSSRGIVALVVALFLLFAGVVAVPSVGILAAIAIPSFLAMQLRAKRAEAPANLDGIRAAELAYHAMWDEYVGLPRCPEGEPGRDPVAFSSDCHAAYDALGWTPEGPVRCRYRVEIDTGGDPALAGFEAVAECDLDEVGDRALYVATDEEKARLQTPQNVF